MSNLLRGVKGRVFAAFAGVTLASACAAGRGDSEGAPTGQIGSALEADGAAPEAGADASPTALARSWRSLSDSTTSRPTARIAFHRPSGHLVRFGGTIAAYNGGVAPAVGPKTWIFVNGRWESVAAVVEPPPRVSHAFGAELGGSLLVFGGQDISNGTLFGDTWRWDGQAWSELHPVQSPPARQYAQLLEERGKGRSLLIGGSRAGFTSDRSVWSWDGSTWNELSAARIPEDMWVESATVDLHRDVVVAVFRRTEVLDSGLDVTTHFVAELVNDAWVLRAQLNDTGGGLGFTMGYDPSEQRVLVFGRDAWDWRGGILFRVLGAEKIDLNKYMESFAVDEAAGRLVASRSIFTWSAWGERLDALVGGAWAPLAQMEPALREGHALIYDERRHVGVLFGGAPVSGSTDRKPLADTWELAGTQWTWRRDVGSPGPRSRAAVAWDPNHGRILAFGGENCSDQGCPQLDDLWSYDGVAWTRLPASTPQPSARSGAYAAYDAARDVFVVTGSFWGTTAERNETWEWNGQAWSRTNDGAHDVFTNRIAYEPHRHAIIGFPKNVAAPGSLGTPTASVYAYTAGPWTREESAYFGNRQASDDFTVVYDSTRGVTDLFLFVHPQVSNPYRSAIFPLEWAAGAYIATQTPETPTFNATPTGYYDAHDRRVVLFGTTSQEFNQNGQSFWEYRVGAAGQGGACAVDGDCQGGTCVDGVCCESACGRGDPARCTTCRGPEGAPQTGVCRPVAAATACGQASADGCLAAGRCVVGDAGIACVQDRHSNDGHACQQGTCNDGTCVAPDAGPPDAGPLDAGALDAAAQDGGSRDAGPRDSGADADDASHEPRDGSAEASVPSHDAAAADASALPIHASQPSDGCSCRAAAPPSPSGSAALFLVLPALVLRRSRRRG